MPNITFDQFIEKWTGKVCDYDNFYGSQCVDLFDYYCFDVLGLSDAYIRKNLFVTNPIELYARTLIDFEKIGNTLFNYPQKGDIAIWGSNVGVNGHISIVTEANILNLKSFDANWPVGALPHIQDHNYTGMLGWLRFKSTPVSPQDATGEVFKEACRQIKAIVDSVGA